MTRTPFTLMTLGLLLTCLHAGGCSSPCRTTTWVAARPASNLVFGPDAGTWREPPPVTARADWPATANPYPEVETTWFQTMLIDRQGRGRGDAGWTYRVHRSVRTGTRGR